MGRKREGSYSLRTLNLDPNETDKFIENLPKGTSLSESVREYIRQENEVRESEKKELPPAKGAIVNYVNYTNKVLSKKKQISLDVFAKDYEELNEKERTQFRIDYRKLGEQIQFIHTNEGKKISKFPRLPY